MLSAFSGGCREDQAGGRDSRAAGCGPGSLLSPWASAAAPAGRGPVPVCGEGVRGRWVTGADPDRCCPCWFGAQNSAAGEQVVERTLSCLHGGLAQEGFLEEVAWDFPDRRAEERQDSFSREEWNYFPGLANRATYVLIGFVLL